MSFSIVIVLVVVFASMADGVYYKDPKAIGGVIRWSFFVGRFCANVARSRRSSFSHRSKECRRSCNRSAEILFSVHNHHTTCGISFFSFNQNVLATDVTRSLAPTRPSKRFSFQVSLVACCSRETVRSSLFLALSNRGSNFAVRERHRVARLGATTLGRSLLFRASRSVRPCPCAVFFD